MDLSTRKHGRVAMVQLARFIAAVQAASNLVISRLMIWLVFHGPPVVHDGRGSWCGLAAGIGHRFMSDRDINGGSAPLVRGAVGYDHVEAHRTIYGLLLVEALIPACVITDNIAGLCGPTSWQMPIVSTWPLCRYC